MSSLNHYLTVLVQRTMPTRCIKVPELEFFDRPRIVKYLEDKLERKGITVASWDASQANSEKANGPGLIRRIDTIFQEVCKYSILSHTWLRSEQGGEIDYKDALFYPNSLKGSIDNFYKTKSFSYRKLQGFFELSSNAKVSFAWADTLCINKDVLVTPLEVSICIPNMFGWYSRSAVCIVYLANSNNVEDMQEDPWFTRGWTLQELLAPTTMVFYGSNWQCLGGYSKNQQNNIGQIDISAQVTEASGMRPEDLLNFQKGLGSASIPARMYWMLIRETTIPQDKFYALIGIFRIRRMDIRYEDDSDTTFFNLLLAILANELYSNDLSIFNYGGRSVDSSIATTSILPSTLECYRKANMALKEINDMCHLPGCNLTPKGLAVNVVLVFGIPIECSKNDTTSFKFRLVQNVHSSGRIWSRKAFSFELLNENEEDEKKITRFKESNCVVFAIWSFEDQTNAVCFPHTCSAFLLGLKLADSYCENGVSTLDFPKEMINRSAKIDTVRPIVFKRRRCIPRVNAPTAAVGANPANQDRAPTGNVGTGTVHENEKQGLQHSAPVSSQDLQSRQIRDARLKIRKNHLYLHNMIYMSTYL